MTRCLSLAAAPLAVALLAVGACTPSPSVAVSPPEPAEPLVSAAAPSVAPAPPAPVSGALPDDPPRSLRPHVDCTPEVCPHDGLTPAVPASPGAPAAMWSQSIAAGTSLSLRRHGALTLLGVTLAGRARLRTRNPSDGIDSWPLAPWTAFRAPGIEVTIDAVEATDLVLAVVTGGDALEPLLKEAPPPADPRAIAPPRPGRVTVRAAADSEDLAWAGGAMHARILFEDGPASLQIMIGAAGAGMAAHDHPTSWEIIGLLDAEGRFELGETASPATAGAVLGIAPRVRHAWTPSGARPLLAVQLYVPPGPEQRFRALAAGTR